MLEKAREISPNLTLRVLCWCYTVVVLEDDDIEATDPEVFLDGIIEPKVGLMVALDELLVGLMVVFKLTHGWTYGWRYGGVRTHGWTLTVVFELMGGLTDI